MDKIKELLEKIYPSLVSVIRYSTRPRIHNETLAEHSYFVTLICSLLYDEYKNKININYEKLMKMAMIHDFEEIVTGDIVYDAKSFVNKDNVDKDKIFNKIFGKNNKAINLISEYDKKYTIEAKIIKLADWISFYVYVINEGKLGNTYMVDIYFRSKRMINKLLNDIRGDINEEKL